MNTIVKSVLLSAALVLPALSGTAYSHQQGNKGGGMMMNPEMMGQQMMDMRERMQENHALMENIIAEDNVEKRDKMMKEHMESMQDQMRGMDKMMSDELASGTTSEDMGERMEMMNMRMNMMQMMMGQMMEYQDQAE